MVNSMGHQFADVGGASIQTIPGGGDLTIDKEGQVFQNGQVVGQVGVFVFENPLLDLQKVGGGFVAKEAETSHNLPKPNNLRLCRVTWRAVMFQPLRK